MSIKVVQYPRGNGVNVAPVSIKQYINNGATLVPGGGGMPMKPRYADNSTTFAIGRQAYTNTPVGFGFVQDYDTKLQCSTGSIRVDIKPNPNEYNITAKSLVKNPTLTQNTWSTSSYRAPTRTNYINIQNGKMSKVLSSDEHINRRKNLAIGRGTYGSTKPWSEGALSFNANNLYGSHTNYLEVTNARRRTRNGGYVVPPKCRGLGSGPRGPFGAVTNRGTLDETGPGLQPQNPKGNSCGKAGWSVNTLLGGDKTAPPNEIITTRLFNLAPAPLGVTTKSETIPIASLRFPLNPGPCPPYVAPTNGAPDWITPASDCVVYNGPTLLPIAGITLSVTNDDPTGITAFGFEFDKPFPGLTSGDVTVPPGNIGTWSCTISGDYSGEATELIIVAFARNSFGLTERTYILQFTS